MLKVIRFVEELGEIAGSLTQGPCPSARFPGVCVALYLRSGALGSGWAFMSKAEKVNFIPRLRFFCKMRALG